MRVLIQLRSAEAVSLATADDTSMAALAVGLEARTFGLTIDPTFTPVQIPGVRLATTMAAAAAVGALTQPVTFSFAPEASSYLVRGTIVDGGLQHAALAAATSNPDVVGVFSDPVIEPSPVCSDSPPLGSVRHVADQLHVHELHQRGLDGTGVHVAVVDTGINVAYLTAMGWAGTLSTAKSWTPKNVATKPGRHPVGHGTMCAYDVAIAAPNARLLDHAVLLSSTPGAVPMAGLLSDAVVAYSRLRRVLRSLPASRRALVITNSWGMYSPLSDFPPGHPGNYSDNPAHPFNILVASLESEGADILFAAGNCGRDCPDGRCAFGGAYAIAGANSHPSVLCVGGVDVTRTRVGYSSQGPGRLHAQKPDIMAYAHFAGSGVYPADAGTSAACPVAAGVVSAVRSKYPATRLSPADIRALCCRTAEAGGSPGVDYDYGWGTIAPSKILDALPVAEAVSVL